MSKEDLLELMNPMAVHSLYKTLKDKMDNAAIVNVYTVNGNCIKIKGDKHISLIDITPDYITVAFDSHVTDIMFTGIESVEYLGGKMNGNNYFRKITKR